MNNWKNLIWTKVHTNQLFQLGPPLYVPLGPLCTPWTFRYLLDL